MNQPIEKRDGLLLVVSGPAGVGKGTVNNILLQKHENTVFSVSCTTRSPRPAEVDGVHYYFVTEEKFRQMIDEDAFLEYMHVFGLNYYGTPKEPVFRHMAEGRDVILDIDVNGAMRVKEAYPDAVLIFIAPPSMLALKNRLIGRGTETPEVIEKRFAIAHEELKCIDKYDYIVLNDNLDEAVSRMESIIAAEKCKPSRNAYLIDRLIKE